MGYFSIINYLGAIVPSLFIRGYFIFGVLSQLYLSCTVSYMLQHGSYSPIKIRTTFRYLWKLLLLAF